MAARYRGLVILTMAAMSVSGMARVQPSLVDAAVKGDVEAVSKLLQSDGTNLERKNHQGDTALIVAAREGHARVVELLLEAGASTSAANKGGNTPMLVAARAGHLQVVELLLRRDAALDTTNKSGDTALILAVEHRRGEVARVLIRKIQDVAVISARNRTGRSALDWATRNGDAELEKLLRERGATQ